jgi:hypothetical protein
MDSGEARGLLVAIGKSPTTILRALRVEVDLSDFVLSGLVGRTPQTVRRWRREDDVEVPDHAAVAVDDLRSIVAMMVEAGIKGSTIKQFLLSRNTGLGQDRPLDGLRVGLDAFRRVEHVTECFIAGVAPEPGSALSLHKGEEVEPAIVEVPIKPESPREPVGVKSS